MGCAVGGGVDCVEVILRTGASVPASVSVLARLALVGTADVGGTTRPLGPVCIKLGATGSVGLAFSCRPCCSFLTSAPELSVGLSAAVALRRFVALRANSARVSASAILASFLAVRLPPLCSNLANSLSRIARSRSNAARSLVSSATVDID